MALEHLVRAPMCTKLGARQWTLYGVPRRC